MISRDIRETNTKSAEAGVSEAFTGLHAITSLYTSTYGFCCLLPDDAKCFANTDQFSSCQDLLEDISLRSFMWLLGLSALIGNALSIVSRIKESHRPDQNSIQVMFITNLALSDLFMGMYMITIAAADSFYRGRYAQHAEEWTNSIICKAAGLLSVLSSEASVLLVMLISVDRFLSVVFPFETRLHLKATSARILTISAWSFSLLLSLVPALPVPYFDGFYGKSSVCLALPLTSNRAAGWEYSIAVFIGTNFICFMLTFFCYFAIYISVRRSHRRVKDMGAVNTQMMKEQIVMTTKMALVVGTDFACWMPIIIMGILASSNVVEIPADIYAWTAVFILPLNSALNPYLYTLSAVLQRRRKSKIESLTMNMTQFTVVGRKRVISRVEERLRNNCIISSTMLSDDPSIEPIIAYADRCGGHLSPGEERLLTRDLRKAQSYLKAVKVCDSSVTAGNIAIKKNAEGAICQAFFVVSNPSDNMLLFGVGSTGVLNALTTLLNRVDTSDKSDL
ncbi:G-protein coupled receptor GRL101-like [Diadema antillarum]|uniref:G-protein coupled receptor GRL101-like n=1 Tax=Diadema antillarum TaxID=105358 RepID=UPI003A8607AB